MPTLNDLSSEIERFVSQYRCGNLNFERSLVYDLNKNPTRDQNDSPGWPETWPHNDRRGVYAILSAIEVLYVGKASLSPIGARLSSYFRYGPNRECQTYSNHVWSSVPTHVVAWAVPDDRFFEASALEEYLIRILDPPDNTTGRRGT